MIPNPLAAASWLPIDVALAVQVVVLASLSGAVSMAVYAIVSPQRRLGELRARSAQLNAALVKYDGDFAGAMSLIRENLGVSLSRLGYALLPALLAGAPVVLVLAWMMGAYPPVGSTPAEWLQSWLAGYLLVTTLVALGVKFAFRIS